MRTLFVLVLITGGFFAGWHPTVREAEHLSRTNVGRERHTAVFPFVIRNGRFINWGLDHMDGSFALTADEHVSYSIWVGVSWELPWPQYVRKDGGDVQEYLLDYIDTMVPEIPTPQVETPQ